MKKKTEKLLLIILLIISMNNYSQNKESECSELKNGTFEIFENGEKVGTIYRKDNIQIEKYPNREKLSFVKLKYNNCNITFNAFEIKKELDTITWSVTYTKIKKGEFKYIGKPKFLNISYMNEGEIVKTSNNLNSEILQVFCGLKTD